MAIETGLEHHTSCWLQKDSAYARYVKHVFYRISRRGLRYWFVSSGLALMDSKACLWDLLMKCVCA
jgi:hypothetical protein